MHQSKEMMAASVPPMVLAILSRGENYGYAMIQEICERSGCEITWTDGMLYNVLRRLERQGLVRSQWRVTSAGKRRRYYLLRSEGARVLATQRQQWELAYRVLQELCNAGSIVDG